MSAFKRNVAAWVAVLCIGESCLAQSSTVPAPRPNIVFLYADDMGHGDLGSYGNRDARTPNLDRLAAQGTRYTQFYVSHCVCSPTRASFMRGYFPSRWRVFGHFAHMEANAKRGTPQHLASRAAFRMALRSSSRISLGNRR